DVDPYDLTDIVGLCRDPLHTCGPNPDFRLAAVTGLLKTIAYRSFTRHDLDTSIQPEVIGNLPGFGTDVSALLQAGVRPRRPAQFRITNANLSPRLSLSWDPWADGKAKAFVSWGRYY